MAYNESLGRNQDLAILIHLSQPTVKCSQKTIKLGEHISDLSKAEFEGIVDSIDFFPKCSCNLWFPLSEGSNPNFSPETKKENRSLNETNYAKNVLQIENMLIA